MASIPPRKRRPSPRRLHSTSPTPRVVPIASSPAPMLSFVATPGPDRHGFHASAGWAASRSLSARDLSSQLEPSRALVSSPQEMALRAEATAALALNETQRLQRELQDMVRVLERDAQRQAGMREHRDSDSQPAAASAPSPASGRLLGFARDLTSARAVSHDDHSGMARLLTHLRAAYQSLAVACELAGVAATDASSGDKAVLAAPPTRSVSPAPLSARWHTSSPSSLRSHADSSVSGLLEAGDVQRRPHVITVTPVNAASRDASPGSVSSLVQSAVSRADDSVARSRASRSSDGLFTQPRGAAPRLVDASSYSLATASPARSFVASSDSRSSEAVSRLVAAERALAALRLSSGDSRSYTALNLSLGSSVASF